MKKTVLKSLLILALLALYFYLKLQIPLQYSEREISQDAKRYVLQMQLNHNTDVIEAARQYLYYETDYHRETPDRIEIILTRKSSRIVEIRFFDPNVRDDSTRSRIDIITMKESMDRQWEPIEHRWAHKGRGRWGWTTKPLV